MAYLYLCLVSLCCGTLHAKIYAACNYIAISFCYWYIFPLRRNFTFQNADSIAYLQKVFFLVLQCLLSQAATHSIHVHRSSSHFVFVSTMCSASTYIYMFVEWFLIKHSWAIYFAILYQASCQEVDVSLCEGSKFCFILCSPFF